MSTETRSVPPEPARSAHAAEQQLRRQSVPEKLAEQFKSLGVARTFGEPLQVGGQTVVPVAMVQYGFGGGGEPDGTGGGGGGGFAIPLGAVIGRDGGPTVFHPNVIALLAVTIPLTWTAGHAIARVVRAARK